MTLIKLILFSILAISVLGVSQANAEITIVPAQGSGAPGCETTTSGCYLPNSVTVDVGEKVIFSNTDSAAHTFTSGIPDDGPDGVFDTGLLMVDGSYEWSPDTEGEYPYFCMVHPWMIGEIIVGKGDSPSTPIPPTPEPIIDNELEIENQRLRDTILDLKLENRDLERQNTELQNEVRSLKDQIVSMTKEFVDSLTQLNEWFRSQLG